MSKNVAPGLLSRRQFLSGTAAFGLYVGLPWANAQAAGGLEGTTTRSGAGGNFALDGYRLRDLHPGVLPKKWREMAARHRLEEVTAPPDCAWNRLARDFGRRRVNADLLRDIDARIAAYRYGSDAARWGVSDYWATPREFMARGGDCEDYAITKYWLLRACGMNLQDLAVIICQRREDRAVHAITGCSIDGNMYFLDRLRNEPVRGWPARRYRPLYLVNEVRWALYVSGGPALQARLRKRPHPTLKAIAPA